MTLRSRTLRPLKLAALIALGGLGFHLSPANAHSLWLQPSSTILAKAQWITVDAAVSNDFFFYSAAPLALDNLTVTAPDGSIEYESTDQGWLAYFNDLHKGRNTGTVWAWFIDIFAVACLLSSLTGLLILQFHAGQRPSTWPLVGLGLVIPLILALLFIH